MFDGFPFRIPWSSLLGPSGAAEGGVGRAQEICDVERTLNLRGLRTGYGARVDKAGIVRAVSEMARGRTNEHREGQVCGVLRTPQAQIE